MKQAFSQFLRQETPIRPSYPSDPPSFWLLCQPWPCPKRLWCVSWNELSLLTGPQLFADDLAPTWPDLSTAGSWLLAHRLPPIPTEKTVVVKSETSCVKPMNCNSCLISVTEFETFTSPLRYRTKKTMFLQLLAIKVQLT